MLADGLDADSASPARGSTPLAISEVCQRLVVQAGDWVMLIDSALLGAWPPSRIQVALEAMPVKHVVRWLQENLPSGVQSQRRITLTGQKA